MCNVGSHRRCFASLATPSSPMQHFALKSPPSGRLSITTTSSHHIYTLRHHTSTSKAPQHLSRAAAADAAADASTLQDPQPGTSQQQKQQQPQQAVVSQEPQQQQTRQQPLDGLLGPIVPEGGGAGGSGGDHPLEVDRVVERELLDSNGEGGMCSLGAQLRHRGIGFEALHCHP